MDCIDLQAYLPISREKAIHFFWDIIKWHQAWGYIHHVDVDFDDRQHQEFSMALEWQGRPTQIKTVRLKKATGDIEFFCSTPPKNMVYQQGQWVFLEKDDHSCAILAKRQYKLKGTENETPDDYRLRSQIFKEEFSGRVKNLLNSLQTYLSTRQ